VNTATAAPYLEWAEQSKISSGRLMKSNPVSEERTATDTAMWSADQNTVLTHSTGDSGNHKALSALTLSRIQSGKLCHRRDLARQSGCRGGRRYRLAVTKHAAVVAVGQRRKTLDV